MGLQLDDFVLKALLAGAPEVRVAPWDAFAFFPEGSPRLPIQRELRELPWWTAPDLRLAFFRPLSSLSHWLDFRLWPDSPILMHLHNLAWFALLVFLAGWISSRNTLLSACFGFLAIALHHRWRRWRRGGWRPGAVLAPAAFLVGLFCGEGATGALGYLLGHALFLDPTPGWRRLRALLPYGLCLVFWRVLYDAGGFGVERSGFYLDPLRETAAFLHLLPERLGLLFFTQWGFPPMEFVTASGGERSGRILASRRRFMKRLILAGLVCAAAFGATLSAPKVQADPPNCAAVLCLPCPEGTVAAPTPGNCCRCVRP